MTIYSWGMGGASYAKGRFTLEFTDGTKETSDWVLWEGTGSQTGNTTETLTIRTGGKILKNIIFEVEGKDGAYYSGCKIIGLLFV